jgi:signal transduction histidine kinase
LTPAALQRGNTALAAQLNRPVTQIQGARCREVGFCGGGCPACAVGRALSSGAAERAAITQSDGPIFSVPPGPVRASLGGASVVQVAKNVTEEIRSARRLRALSDEVGLANDQLKATLDRLKSTQAQLLQAEKLSAIGQLVAGVAHELNNPLTSVIGYAQLLEEEFRSGGSGRPRGVGGRSQTHRRESGRAARIVKNLLAFARRQTAARVPQDLTELANGVCRCAATTSS